MNTPITETEFNTIHTDKKMRNAIAHAHDSYNSKGVFKHKIALYECKRLIVTEEQVNIAQKLKRQQQEETQNKTINKLVFVAMGESYQARYDDDVENHRVRATLRDNRGNRRIIKFCDVSKDDKYQGLCTHAVENYQTKKEKKMPIEGKYIQYTKQNILKLTNETFKTNFKEVYIDQYDFDPEESRTFEEHS